MTDFAKGIAGTAVGIGAVGLLGESLSMLPGRRRKKKSFVKGATNILVGTALLSGAAGAVNSM